MAQVEPVEITAGSLHLRPWHAQDADAVFAACQDPEIQRWTTVPSPYTRTDAVGFVERIAQVGWLTGTAATLAVVDATTGGLLASIALQDMRDADGVPGVGPGGTAELGYWCAPEARGRGVVTSAAQALCRWGFGALELAGVYWLALVGNDASLAVARKVGFSVAPRTRQLVNRRDGEVAEFRTGTLRPA